MKEEKKSFLKKIKMSIFDFEAYQELAAEKISRTILYIVLLILIFSIVIGAIYLSKFGNGVIKTREYIEKQIAEIEYENYQLTIIPNNKEEITKLNLEDSGIEVIINTQTNDEEKIQESINEINSLENGILLLKDRIIIKNEFSLNTIEYTYKDISEAYNLNKIDKQEVINILSGSQIKIFGAMFFGVIVLYMFIIYFSNVLVDMLLLSMLAYIVSRIAGLRLKYSALYNIATYSLTLSIILNIIYFIVNALTGFVIEYFQIMYTAISSIYIVTSILIIKSDVMKKQVELNKIIEEQERVKQELKRKEEEEKEKQGQERRERENEKREKKQKENKEKEKLNDEPEGDNA